MIIDMDYKKYRHIPNSLKRYRKNMDLTQRELGERLHIDPDWISHWENGDSLPNLVSAIRLSVFLGVPVNDLFGNLNNRIREEVWHGL